MEKIFIYDYKPQKITAKVGPQSDVVVNKETVNDGRGYIRGIRETDPAIISRVT